jgi:malate synthase
MDTLLQTSKNNHYAPPRSMKITGTFNAQYAEMLTPQALRFLWELHRRFDLHRQDLLKKRKVRQRDLDNGILPDFLPATKIIRESDWTVAPIPKDLQDRRVEITGPVDRKMVINALNSGATMFMSDFEDSNSPSWENNIGGQINLRDAIRRTISYTNPENGKTYQLNEKVATLMVRPRGWHLVEKHIIINGEPMSGSLVDFGLYFFHNAKELLKRGSGPYFYLPKIESHLEARLWNDVFIFAQDYCGVAQGAIRATVLIETILATFEVNEILWELRDHSAGLNCGRWDYIFSFIKRLRNQAGFILPDRSKVTMAVPFMRAYSLYVIQSCHRRNVHAMGGMAAQIPIKNNPEANEAALGRVKADKLREVTDGHDGTWVAHPGLVPIAMDIFNANMTTPNQIHRKREDVQTIASELLRIPEGTITEEGLRMNINVGILYIESWLRGNGAAAIHHLMEDAATAEISRTQIWQWIKNKAMLEDGRTITYDLYREFLGTEIEKMRAYVGEANYQNGEFPKAIALFDRLVKDKDFIEFLTLPAYELI